MVEWLATSVIGKVVDTLFGVAKKEISYMWNYKKNVNKLLREAETLKLMSGEVQQQIDNANRQGDELLFGVQEWMKTANEEISNAETFLKEEADVKKTCFKIGICGNWGTFHRYGKRATNMTRSLQEHQVQGLAYKSCVSVETCAPGPLDVYQNKNLDDIDTHNLALRKVVEAIEDETVQIIGIYGLGGVGKTTLAKEVAAKVKNLFADVAFTTVSQTVNVDKVKKDIEKATKQIMQRKKILIILDDVWEKLDLEQLCIPCGINFMNCKIMLTSRSEDVCRKMNAQSKICVDPLPINETWILFKQVVGERVETDVTLKQVAMKVAEECGGLPLLIQAVGNALKDKSIDSWNSALTRLKKHASVDIDQDIKKAFTHLQLSYDYLDSEEAKSCFLLCSMFPEDDDICLEHLVYYEVGLAKFNDLESVNDARDRVQNAVNILTSFGLLLISEEKEFTKMHDVVRDVALSIASKGNNKFLVEAGKGLLEWLPRNNTYELCTGISLMDNKISKLPDYELHFPRLTTFLINDNELSTISNEFIGGMKEARVLDMARNKISSLPQSLKYLTKLRVLNLGGNESLYDISILGELKDLEILILRESGIKEIPHEIGELVKLRLLLVDGCKNLSHISPGVLSKLCWLEELCIGFYSMHEGIYDSLVEVMNLSKLTYLDLLVPCFDVIPEGFTWGKYNGFMIQIGGDKKHVFFLTSNFMSERQLVLSTEDLKTPFMKSVKKLIEVSPYIVLDSVKNLHNIVPDLYHEGFNKLESIWLEDCPNVLCLVDTRDTVEGKTNEMFFTELKHLHLNGLHSLEALCYCPDRYISLSNLVTFDIYNCPKLVRVFSVSVAQGLVSLRELSIRHCQGLEEVIWRKDDTAGETTNIILFLSLAKISFEFLPKLKSFCSGNSNSTIKYPSLVEVNISFCISMKKWGNRTQETPKLKFVNNFVDKFVNKVPLDGPYAINDAMVKSSETWKKANVVKLPSLNKCRI